MDMHCTSRHGSFEGLVSCFEHPRLDVLNADVRTDRQHSLHSLGFWACLLIACTFAKFVTAGSLAGLEAAGSLAGLEAAGSLVGLEAAGSLGWKLQGR